jgi:hypothetical protein
VETGYFLGETAVFLGKEDEGRGRGGRGRAYWSLILVEGMFWSGRRKGVSQERFLVCNEAKAFRCFYLRTKCPALPGIQSPTWSTDAQFKVLRLNFLTG